MSYSIVLARSFKISLRQLECRFRNAREDVKLAVKVLEQNPELGVVIPGASGICKLRVRNSDLNRGKSGGHRLLYWVDDQHNAAIYLLLLYFKGERSDVTRTELQQLLNDLANDADQP